jgi:hypothetical protein
VNNLNSLYSEHHIGRVPGIHYDAKKNLWRGVFRSKGSTIPLGWFITREEAEAAAREVISEQEDALYEQIREMYRRKGIPETPRNLIRWVDLQPVLPLVA